jgi:Holliday junction resolvasome RuvABC DNA-binding subunit
MNTRLNQDIAGKLEEVARLLAEQGANRFRIQAYHRAADLLRALDRPVADIYAEKNLAGLEELPGIGPSIAHAIRDMLQHGQLAMLERLRGESDPVHLLISVPGVGPVLARRLHEELGIETLQELEMAAHDGRLAAMPGLGAKRLAGIRDSLAHRLGRVRKATVPPAVHEEIPVEELLDVDREYREKAAAGQLKKVAPRRFNPSGEAWLPVWHTQRGPRHYTALYSNTARAHQLSKSTDWVVLYYDEGDGERQCTVITSEFGALRGHRIVRGRERECAAYYRRAPKAAPA